jgi:hypothetical protein
VADPGLLLGGIVVMQGIRKAYVFRRTDPSGTWVASGEDAAGIVIGSGDRKIDLKLYPER